MHAKSVSTTKKLLWKYNEINFHKQFIKEREQIVKLFRTMPLLVASLKLQFFFPYRKLKGPGIPTTVLKCAPDSCDVYLVARDRIISKLADSSSSTSHGMAEIVVF